MIPRTLLAVALCAGFYATGLAIALALAWMPWAQSRLTAQGLQLSGAVSLLGAAYVLWALVPPLQRWRAPGPELTESSQPALWALVRRVAAAAGHAVPAHVYLVSELQAFADSRPRWLGLRREPVIGLGLPVFAILDEDELAAVLGHEFGHHAGGDVRLGPWQHRTHRAIAAALDRLDGSSLFLHLPFYAYGRLYLRLTGRASRAQELRADALSAAIAGARSAVGALVAFEQHESRWLGYWHGVFVPMVESGLRAPILEGYRRYLACAPPPADDGAAPHPPDPGDTHPPLAVRLAALGTEAARPAIPKEGNAAPLLADQPAVEERLLASLLTDPAKIGELEAISWDEWGDKALPCLWKRHAGPGVEALQSVPVASLPELLRSDDTWHRMSRGVNVFSPEARRRQVRAWLGSWLGLGLQARGFRVTSGPGAPAVLEGDGLRIAPAQWIEDLVSGRRTDEEWAALWRAVEASGTLARHAG